ncbi:cytochrome b5 [Rickenella mellea]|uniref:Cytochrome b5 n=1 Tax=Rickenella mellea TaxID=50990 RepID=A0A4Y7PYI0_9AGAM|nr:cytochrome b5 [Rickenella mellea]
MTSYLRNWIYGVTPVVQEEPNILLNISPPPSDHEDSASEDGEENDEPPAFPALSSAQRMSSSAQNSSGTLGLPGMLLDSSLMPPPPLPSKALRVPGAPQPTASGGATLQLPPSTTKPPVKVSKRREKVALAPGFGPLDWAALKSSGADLRGVENLLRVTSSMLKEHNKRDDAWTAINGRVYNITPYMPFHPGGEKELMRVAGRDGTKLFGLTHAWVNVEYMLDACVVGFLVN